MDINCPNCGEPYEDYHMRRDEPKEWGLSKEVEMRFLDTGRFEGPEDPALKAAMHCGWEFATNSVYSFLKCPSCSRRPLLADALQRRALRVVASEGLEGDDDALVSALADGGA